MKKIAHGKDEREKGMPKLQKKPFSRAYFCKSPFMFICEVNFDQVFMYGTAVVTFQ